MVEHRIGALRRSVGRYHRPPPAPGVDFARARIWLRADAPFARHVRNPLLPATPSPLRLSSLAAAAAELLLEIDEFFRYYQQPPTTARAHPLFGPLGFADWLVFHFKHVGHHFQQFHLLTDRLLPRAAAAA